MQWFVSMKQMCESQNSDFFVPQILRLKLNFGFFSPELGKCINSDFYLFLFQNSQFKVRIQIFFQILRKKSEFKL